MTNFVPAINKIVECIPNFSEGRDAEKIALLVKSIAAVTDVFVLDQTMDADHHRAVITFAGTPDAVVEAAVRAAATAVELIDLNQHAGAHQRMGALDVLPFVPIKGVTMEDCVELARRAGERIAHELQIPVYLYEQAATRADRVDLSYVRRGGFEVLREQISLNPDRRPDFGPARVHPTAGAMAVGARLPLIAYNINLATEDVAVAKKIAHAVRGSNGGLRGVKAWGLELQSRRQAQVSMNLVNYEATPIFRVFEMVKREAARYGVLISGSEIVGLVPQAALNACADFYLQIETFTPELILEYRLQNAIAERNREEASSTEQQLAALREWMATQPSTPAPAPPITEPDTYTLDRGGGVPAYVGSLAAGLGELIGNLTLNQKPALESEARSVLEQLKQLGEGLRAAVGEEMESRASVLDAMALPRSSDAERLARTMAIEQATKNAISTPLRVAEQAAGVLELFNELTEISDPHVFSDLTLGAQLAFVALRGASYNVLPDLLNISDREFVAQCRAQLDELLARGQEAADQIEELFMRLYAPEQ
jgi:glutamate formiminotransferase / formiminotetrahydrofolate cyclodeaminase